MPDEQGPARSPSMAELSMLGAQPKNRQRQRALQALGKHHGQERTLELLSCFSPRADDSDGPEIGIAARVRVTPLVNLS